MDMSASISLSMSAIIPSSGGRSGMMIPDGPQAANTPISTVRTAARARREWMDIGVLLGLVGADWETAAKHMLAECCTGVIVAQTRVPGLGSTSCAGQRGKPAVSPAIVTRVVAMNQFAKVSSRSAGLLSWPTWTLRTRPCTP